MDEQKRNEAAASLLKDMERQQRVSAGRSLPGIIEPAMAEIGHELPFND